MKKRTFIDLSVAMKDTPAGFFPATKVTRISHEENAKKRAKEFNLPVDFFPDSTAAAYEMFEINAHSGTHLDAPWHFGPKSMGRPSKTIDEIPLEWCFGDGVVLDLRHVKAGERISAADVEEAVLKIGYKLKPFDIVLIRTDASKRYLEPDYDYLHPGMSRESTFWLIEQGIKVMGIDAKGWDRARKFDLEEVKRGIKGQYWQGHFAGREKEYCHIENLANLDLIPKPCGFTVVAFPVKVLKGSAGWVRVVAIVEE